jgi:glucosamine--fructose-6-phosphate aminotransferase (isomerizing)
MEEPLNALFADIQGQPDSLAHVIAHQLGEGAADAARAAAEIRHARHLIFSGMGGSLFAAMPAVAMLNARGRTCVALEAAEMLYFHDAHDRGTLAVLVSRSGETVEAIKLLPKLHKRGVRVIGVTNVRDSTLARKADITILVESAPDKMVALRTYTGTVTALLMLASAACGAALPDLQRLPRTMKETIDRGSSTDLLTRTRSIAGLGSRRRAVVPRIRADGGGAHGGGSVSAWGGGSNFSAGARVCVRITSRNAGT